MALMCSAGRTAVATLRQLGCSGVARQGSAMLARGLGGLGGGTPRSAACSGPAASSWCRRSPLNSPCSIALAAASMLPPRFASSLAGESGQKRIRLRGLNALELPADLSVVPRINLNNLRNVPGSTKQKIRVGRGRSGRRGKTSGRGHKGGGQHGASLPFWFQGGQSPIWQTSPKIGKPSRFSVEYVPLNLSKIHNAIKAGKLDPQHPINLRHLWRAGVVTGSFKSIGQDCWGVKLLSTGKEDFDVPITIEVQRASKSAIYAVENAGGTIQCKYYNKLGLRALMLPEKFPYGIPRLPMPRPKLRKWYEDPENRGVLPPPLSEQTPMSKP